MYVCAAAAPGPWTSSVGADPKFDVRAAEEAWASSLRRVRTAAAGTGHPSAAAAITAAPVMRKVLHTPVRKRILLGCNRLR
jgi:hypothetical protein